LELEILDQCYERCGKLFPLVILQRPGERENGRGVERIAETMLK